MHTGFFDMLQYAGHRNVGAIADRIDIHLDRVAQILVDQHRRVARNLHRRLNVIVELLE